MQTNPSGSKRTIEQSGFNEKEGHAKRAGVNSTSAQNSTTKGHMVASSQPTFRSASQIYFDKPANKADFPEISDEELLEMALEFERKHPQR